MPSHVAGGRLGTGPPCGPGRCERHGWPSPAASTAAGAQPRRPASAQPGAKDVDVQVLMLYQQ